MIEINKPKPDIIQSFDLYKDREYYKITPGFFCSSETKVRTDHYENWTEWQIKCEKMPDKVVINGKNYELQELMP